MDEIQTVVDKNIYEHIIEEEKKKKQPSLKKFFQQRENEVSEKHYNKKSTGWVKINKT
jgi:hypothetical protein